jgi:hypothetical protein
MISFEIISMMGSAIQIMILYGYSLCYIFHNGVIPLMLKEILRAMMNSCFGEIKKLDKSRPVEVNA